MYGEFFGFRELPFNNTPDPRFFFSTPDHEEALASLIYGVRERKGFVLLTGEVGAGKTLVTRLMLRHFGTHIAFATINHAVKTPEDLMESICTEFELPFKPEATSTQLIRKLHDFLLAQFAQDLRVVLVLDEAQNLPIESFERLRMIGNLEADDAKLLQTAIVGQPELQRMFLSPELRQLRQRIFRAFHLPALNREKTEEYIRHRLSVVTNAKIDIFGGSAFDAIYKFSRGVPRIINTVCDNSLLSAYSANQNTIDGALVDTVIAQMLVVGDPRNLPERETHPAPEKPSSTTALPPSSTRSQERSSRGIQTPQAHTRPDPLARSIEAMAQGVADIGAQFRHRTPVEGEPVLTETPKGPDERSGSTRRTPAPLDQDGQLRLDQVTRRLGAVERRLAASRLGDLTEARAIRVSLEHLVKQARSLAARAEGASQQMQQHDQQIRTLTTTIKTVTHDLRHLLNRAQETTTKNCRAERSARVARERLVAQTERSRELADELTQIVSRIIRRYTSTVPSAALLKETSVPAGSVPHPTQGTTARRTDAPNVQQALASMRESLSDLRSLARNTVEDPNGSSDESTELPAARLADQVENLLKIIGPHGSPANSGSGACSEATTAKTQANR